MPPAPKPTPKPKAAPKPLRRTTPLKRVSASKTEPPADHGAFAQLRDRGLKAVRKQLDRKRKPEQSAVRGSAPQRKTRIKARGKKGSKFPHLRNPEWCAYVRSLPCILTGRADHRCVGLVECCHVRSRGAGGVDEGNTFPACRGAHEEQHRIGIRSFQAKYRVDLAAIAAALTQRAA